MKSGSAEVINKPDDNLLDFSQFKPEFMKKISALGASFGSGDINLSNNVNKYSVGNTKVNNIHHTSHTSSPVINARNLGKFDSRIGASAAGGVFSDPIKSSAKLVDAESETEVKDDKKGGGKKEKRGKKKASAEQKDLKEKLIELTDKVGGDSIGTPEQPLLKYNPESGQFEPVKMDASSLEAKEKLKEAISAISAKKLPTQMLRRILDDGSSSTATGSEEQVFDNDGDLNDNGIPDYQEQQHQQQPETNEAFDVDQQQQQQERQPNGRELDILKSTNPRRGSKLMTQQEEIFARPGSTDYEGEKQDLYSQGEQYGFKNGHDSRGNLERNSYVDSQYSSGSHEHGYNGEEPTGNEIKAQLDDRLNRISDLLYFRPEFMNQLLQINDAVELTPLESEFKRMILCNSDEQFCLQDIGSLSGFEPMDDATSNLGEHLEIPAEEPIQQYEYVNEEHDQQQQLPAAETEPIVFHEAPVFRRTSSTRTYESVHQSAKSDGSKQNQFATRAMSYRQQQQPHVEPAQPSKQSLATAYQSGFNGGAANGYPSSSSSTSHASTVNSFGNQRPGSKFQQQTNQPPIQAPAPGNRQIAPVNQRGQQQRQQTYL